MSVHIKNIKGHDYAYEVKSCWNKETKKRFKTTKYLGAVTNSETGEYERKRPIKTEQEKEILTYGNTYLINESLKNSSIYDKFKEILPENQDTLKSLLCYKIIDGSAFMHAKTWYEGNIASKFFPTAQMDSQRISEFLEKLGHENTQRAFFKKYLTSLSGNGINVAMDSTGLPNEINIPLTEYGHHGGDASLETRLIMVLDQKTKMPLYFRLVAGNICDVSTLITTSAEIKRYGLNTEFMLLDAGYYSDNNIRALYQAKIGFLTRLPAGRKLFSELINKTENSLEKAKHAVFYNKRSLYIQEVVTETCGYKCYAYVCLDVKEHGKKLNNFIKNAKEDNLDDDEFDKKAKSIGKFVLISNKKLDLTEVLPLYYTRLCAEEAFGIVKSKLDLLPLRTHTVQTLKGYTFLCFLALIISIEIQTKLGGLSTFQEVLHKSKNHYCKIFENDIVISESQKYMNDVFTKIGVGVPNQLGV
jgi:transposase